MIFVVVALIAALALQEYLHRVERMDWLVERQRLLTLRFENRETTPVVIAGEDTEPPEWIAPDDDKAFHEAVKERN